ncbi:hypothetical protein HDV06_001047 [Boothiomyces sp. JEL0866]|nr:hypothetical protein HDV06_001047 [Boothiomyces sp. JEL0866]
MLGIMADKKTPLGLYTSESTEINIDIYCPASQYVNPTTGLCSACPSGSISLTDNLNISCTSLSNPYGVGISATVAIGIVFQLVVLAGLLLYKNGKVIRSSDASLSSIIVLGYLTLHIYTAFLPTVSTKTTCMAKPFLLVESLALIISAGLIKHYKLYEIFFVNSFKIGKVTSRFLLYSAVLLALAVPAIIFLAWYSLSPPTPLLISTSAGSHYIGCVSSGSFDTIFETVFSVYLILLAIISLYLCYRLKETAPAFIDFQGTLKSIYQGLTLFVVLILLNLFIGDKFAVDLVQGLLVNLLTIYVSATTMGKLLYNQLLDNSELSSKRGSSKTSASMSSRQSKIVSSVYESQLGQTPTRPSIAAPFNADTESPACSDQVIINKDGIQLVNVYSRIFGRGFSTWEIVTIYIYPVSNLAFIRKYKNDQAVMTSFYIQNVEMIDEPETEKDQGKYMIYSRIEGEKKGQTAGHKSRKEVGITIRFQDRVSRDKCVQAFNQFKI